MAITLEEYGKIKAIITGESERVFSGGLNAPSLEQAAAMMDAVNDILGVAEVFDPDQILVEAAKSDPDEVFTGEAGLAKLAAWATSAGYTKA
jgi:hypothetical protein